jgi:hypothetical protein
MFNIQYLEFLNKNLNISNYITIYEDSEGKTSGQAEFGGSIKR